jgi:hypothetical protein
MTASRVVQAALAGPSGKLIWTPWDLSGQESGYQIHVLVARRPHDVSFIFVSRANQRGPS